RGPDSGGPPVWSWSQPHSPLTMATWTSNEPPLPSVNLTCIIPRPLQTTLGQTIIDLKFPVQ
ncbi:hypothetical protein Pmani_038953, partial [Petrolisthes manimaculis]